MTVGTLDQFLDCLDFAPEAIKESIKDIAVELPLNDIMKRDAIRDKLGFDVSRAIEIKNTKYDGGDINEAKSNNSSGKRRSAPLNNAKGIAAPSGRRYQPATK